MSPHQCRLSGYELMTSWQGRGFVDQMGGQACWPLLPSDLMNPSFYDSLICLSVSLYNIIFTAMVCHNMLWLQFPHYLIMDLKTSFKIRTFKCFWHSVLTPWHVLQPFICLRNSRLQRNFILCEKDFPGQTNCI